MSAIHPIVSLLRRTSLKVIYKLRYFKKTEISLERKFTKAWNMYEVDADVVPVFKSSISWRTSLQACWGVLLFSGTSMVWRMGGCPTHGRLICLYLSDACASTRLLRSQHQHNNLTARKESTTSERERETEMPDMVKGCWMVLHTDIQMNNEKGRVVLLSMRDIFWGNISLLVKEMMWQKNEGKAVESFASYVRYFKKKR